MSLKLDFKIKLNKQMQKQNTKHDTSLLIPQFTGFFYQYQVRFNKKKLTVSYSIFFYIENIKI